MWVFENDAMGCSECYEDELRDDAVLPPHLQPHKRLSAGICGMCGYVLDPTALGYAEQIAERLRDAAAVLRHVSLNDGDRALRVEGRDSYSAALPDDLREATQAILAMGAKLNDAGVDRADLGL